MPCSTSNQQAKNTGHPTLWLPVSSRTPKKRFFEKSNNTWTAPNSVLATAWQWFCQYPAVAGMGVIAIGGLVILIYFLRLGFIPDFDVTSILGVLILTAALTPPLVIVAGIIFLIPSLSTSMFVGKSDFPPWKTWKGTLTCVLLTNIFWIILLTAISHGPTKTSDAAAEYITTGSLGIIIFATAILSKLKNKANKQWQRHIRWYGIFLIMAVPNFFLSAIWIATAIFSGLKNTDDWHQIAAAIIYLIASGWANATFLQIKNITAKLVLFFCIATAATLTLLTNGANFLHILPIKYLQFGEVKGVTITVSKPASAALDAACEISNVNCRKIKQDEKYATYHDITILSRLGNHYYLQICQFSITSSGDGCEGANTKLAIDKKDVFGWSKHREDDWRSMIGMHIPWL